MNAANRMRRGDARFGLVVMLPIGLALEAIRTGSWVESAFAPAYLSAWLFWLGVTLGCHALIWIHHLTGGAWGRFIAAELRASARTLPLVALGFLPIAWFVHDLYEWSRSGAAAHDLDRWSANAIWFRTSAFYVRSAIYLMSWLLCSWYVGYRERGWHRHPNDRTQQQLRRASAQSLLVYGISMTLAAYDWGMSLERHWYSAAYGILFVIGQGVAGLAWSIMQVSQRMRRSSEVDAMTPSVSGDLGNLLLAFTMLWAYISFSQFLIIWYADLPEEVVWYQRRSQNGWQWIAAALAAIHFALPFLALLRQRTKRDLRTLFVVAGIVLGMRWLDLAWHVIPVFDSLAVPTVAVALVTWFCSGLLWWTWYAWQHSRRTGADHPSPFFSEASAP